MSVKIENGDGFVKIRNDIGTVKFKDNGVFETVDSVGWIDDSTGKMTVFKRNKVYTLVFLRTDFTGGSQDGRITYRIGSMPVIDETISVPMQYAYIDGIYGSTISRPLSKIPFTIKSIRATVVKEDLGDHDTASIPDLRSSLPPYEGGLSLNYWNVLQDNKEILNNKIAVEPRVSVIVYRGISGEASSHPTTQDTMEIMMDNPGTGSYGYEFTMDFIYDN